MFKLLNQPIKNSPRQGRINVGHGELTTPLFMPDATRGVVKMLDSFSLRQTGTKAMVVNTFHLYLQPGLKVIKKAGGVHKLMNWPGPLLSDSGGFQVFSLIYQNSKMGRIYNDKVVFKSPLDGSKHELTPEKSIQIQFDLGTDMMVCLDDCPPNDFNRAVLERSIKRTIEWAKRCRQEFDKQIKKRGLKGKNKPLLFGVIQGGAELDLRQKCAQELIKLDFDGYGFGARPVDKQGNFLVEVIQYTANLIPEDKIRFALGIGLPEDIGRCVKMGWDLFDCVIPTREARHGKLYQFKTPLLNRQGFPKQFYQTINIQNTKFAADFSAINPTSNLPQLREYSKAYLHHLFKINESLGLRLASLNNLEFYHQLLICKGNNYPM